MFGNMEIMYSQISGCIFLLSQDHNKMKQASHLFTASLRVMLQLKNSRGKSLLCFLPLITDNISSPFYRIIGYLKELGGWKEPLKTTQPSPTHDQLGFKQLLGESPLPYFNTLRVKKSSCMLRCTFLYFNFCPCPPVLSIFCFSSHSTILCLQSNSAINHVILKKQSRSAKLPHITQDYPLCRGLFLQPQVIKHFSKPTS